MTARIPKVIPKDGKVWRLTKESWDALAPFDSDPNVAIEKIMKAIGERPAEAPGQHNSCNFDEKKLQKIVKETMESVIAPFTGS
jgi:hypothetical protein